jgi:hypothetical protein
MITPEHVNGTIKDKKENGMPCIMFVSGDVLFSRSESSENRSFKKDLRRYLKKIDFDVLVLDDQDVSCASDVQYLCGLKYDSLWMVCNDYDLCYRSIFRLFGWDKIWQYPRKEKSKKLLHYGMFNTLCWVAGNGKHGLLLVNHAQVPTIGIWYINSDRDKQYQRWMHQFFVLFARWEWSGIPLDTQKYEEVIRLMGLVFSGIPVCKAQMSDEIMNLMGGERVSGGLYRRIPPYRLLEVQHVPKETQECAICLEDIPKYPIKNESCTHVFCYGCIKLANVKTGTCPMCRVKFESTWARALSSDNVSEIQGEVVRHPGIVSDYLETDVYSLYDDSEEKLIYYSNPDMLHLSGDGSPIPLILRDEYLLDAGMNFHMNTGHLKTMLELINTCDSHWKFISVDNKMLVVTSMPELVVIYSRFISLHFPMYHICSINKCGTDADKIEFSTWLNGLENKEDSSVYDDFRGMSYALIYPSEVIVVLDVYQTYFCKYPGIKSLVHMGCENLYSSPFMAELRQQFVYAKYKGIVSYPGSITDYILFYHNVLTNREISYTYQQCVEGYIQHFKNEYGTR